MIINNLFLANSKTKSKTYQVVFV